MADLAPDSLEIEISPLVDNMVLDGRNSVIFIDVCNAIHSSE